MAMPTQLEFKLLKLIEQVREKLEQIDNDLDHLQTPESFDSSLRTKIGQNLQGVLR